MRRPILILLVLLAGLAIGAIAASSLRLDKLFGGGPDPETVATATLQSVREQSRLTVFAARFVAVVTSSQNRFGLSAQKTLIMPGTVRYEIDLARLTQRDLAWDAEERRLEIVLPPLDISQPQVNLNELREYGGESVLTALTGRGRGARPGKPPARPAGADASGARAAHHAPCPRCRPARGGTELRASAARRRAGCHGCGPLRRRAARRSVRHGSIPSDQRGAGGTLNGRCQVHSALYQPNQCISADVVAAR
jgi:hypothetical protein